MAHPRTTAVESASQLPPQSRLLILRTTLLLACFLTMVACTPVWVNSRLYPLIPIATWWPILPVPLDKIAFGVVLACLVLACWRFRPAVIGFLAGSLFLVLSDQARMQPWLYMYWVLLVLSLAEPPSAMAACRIAISAIYLWSGIQKCNAHYFNVAAPWLAKGGASWMAPFVVTLIKDALMLAPIVEIFIGIAVWFRPTRMLAIISVLAVHLTALLILGPLGHKHNWIVWPWNLVMLVLVVILFPAGALSKPWQHLRRAVLSPIVLVLFCFLPVLSFFGYWDSYLSFSLYSGHLTQADLFISAEVRDRLPAPLLEFVVPMKKPYNQEVQGPFIMLVELWADKILRVPPLPEARGYRAAARYLASFAPDPDDVHMLVIPRVGPLLFYRGSDLRRRAGIPINPPAK